MSEPGEEEIVVDSEQRSAYGSPDSIAYQYTVETTRQSSCDDGTIVIDWGSVGNLIEEILSSYEQLQERRRLFYCPRTLLDLLGGTVPKFTKIDTYFNNDKLSIESAIIVEFVRSIQPFAMFDLESQVKPFRIFLLL